MRIKYLFFILFFSTTVHAGKGGGGGADALEKFRSSGKQVISFLQNNEEGELLALEYNLDINHLLAANSDQNIDISFVQQYTTEGKVREAYVDSSEINTIGKYRVWEINLYAQPNKISYSFSFVLKELLRSSNRNDLVLRDAHIIIADEMLNSQYDNVEIQSNADAYSLVGLEPFIPKEFLETGKTRLYQKISQSETEADFVSSLQEIVEMIENPENIIIPESRIDYYVNIQKILRYYKLKNRIAYQLDSIANELILRIASAPII